jgi:hypothetical protein|tara:strand:- start:10 stop:135 length:126 start_codon:yes stop_codon:yes gene_type:complete
MGFKTSNGYKKERKYHEIELISLKKEIFLNKFEIAYILTAL